MVGVVEVEGIVRAEGVVEVVKVVKVVRIAGVEGVIGGGVLTAKALLEKLREGGGEEGSNGGRERKGKEERGTT